MGLLITAKITFDKKVLDTIINDNDKKKELNALLLTNFDHSNICVMGKYLDSSEYAYQILGCGINSDNTSIWLRIKTVANKIGCQLATDILDRSHFRLDFSTNDIELYSEHDKIEIEEIFNTKEES